MEKQDLFEIMSIENEMYGNRKAEGTFQKCLDAFPDECCVATMNRHIVGFIIAELVDQIKVVSKIHDPTQVASRTGTVVYVAGFGVRNNLKKQTKIGILLYRELVLLASKHQYRLIESICEEEEPKDQYEVDVIRALGFSKTESVEWEAEPNKTCEHGVWIKRINHIV
jgi:hypothetical protein